MWKLIGTVVAAALALGILGCSSSGPQPEQKKLEGNRIPKGKGPANVGNRPAPE